jgi:hypothetical protein
VNVLPERGPLGNDARGKWHALRSGTSGVCEAHGYCTEVFEPNERPRATPATEASERNLRLSRREFGQVKAVETLDQNGNGVRRVGYLGYPFHAFTIYRSDGIGVSCISSSSIEFLTLLYAWMI